MRHFASNFMTRFKDKILKNLVCRAALASTERKFKKHMNTIGRINSEALQWLEYSKNLCLITRHVKLKLKNKY